MPTPQKKAASTAFNIAKQLFSTYQTGKAAQNAIKQPAMAPRPIPKPAQKPAPKPAPKATPRPQPKPATASTFNVFGMQVPKPVAYIGGSLLLLGGIAIARR